MNKIDFLPGLTAYHDVDITLEEFLVLTSDVEWKDATVGRSDEESRSEVHSDIRSASVKNVKNHYDKIDKLVSEYVEDYAKNAGLSDLEHEYYSLVRYTEGQFFSEHSDGGEFLPRRLSMVLYLNDDYDGGEISFTRFRSTIKTKARTLLLFPSTDEYSHAAQPVLSGTKYALIGFWK